MLTPDHALNRPVKNAKERERACLREEVRITNFEVQTCYGRYLANETVYHAEFFTHQMSANIRRLGIYMKQWKNPSASAAEQHLAQIPHRRLQCSGQLRRKELLEACRQSLHHRALLREGCACERLQCAARR